MADRNILDRQAEEAREAVGFRVGPNAFQSAPEDFRPDIDAEGRLQARLRG